MPRIAYSPGLWAPWKRLCRDLIVLLRVTKRSRIISSSDMENMAMAVPNAHGNSSDPVFEWPLLDGYKWGAFFEVF